MGKSDQLIHRSSTAARSLMHSKPPKAAGTGESQSPAHCRASDTNDNSNGSSNGIGSSNSKQREIRTAGGFADLLEAVLSQQDNSTSPEPAYLTDAPKPGRQISSTAAGRSSALQDVTNTQVNLAEHTLCLPSAPKAVTVAGKQYAKAKQQAETVVFTRRSARVKAKKDHSKPEHAYHSQEQSMGNTDLFGVNHQVRYAKLPAASDSESCLCAYSVLQVLQCVELMATCLASCICAEVLHLSQGSMPSIDDEDIERQVKERMQRHRRKNMKRFSRMSK